MFFFFCSPSLTGKKSNEILQGGLSSIKHAATSVAKKLDEIKEAISANTTPVKSNGPIERSGAHLSEDDLLNENSSRSRRVSGELDLWGRLSESRKSSYNNLVPLGENSVSGGGGGSSQHMHPYPILPDSVYSHVAEVSLVFHFCCYRLLKSPPPPLESGLHRQRHCHRTNVVFTMS